MQPLDAIYIGLYVQRFRLINFVVYGLYIGPRQVKHGIKVSCMKIGDHSKSWAPQIVCRICQLNLMHADYLCNTGVNKFH